MPTATWISPEAVPPAAAVAGVQLPEPFSLVLFGATGDLAARKLLPSLHGLWQKGFLPRDFIIT